MIIAHILPCGIEAYIIGALISGLAALWRRYR